MRIVSLLPAATDIVAALGALPQLVGRTHECDWPAGQVDDIPIVTATSLPAGLSSREISAEVAGAPHHGSSIYQLDHAALDALRPDLILTQDLCDVCAVSYRAVNDAVRVMDLDTTVMSLQPATIDAILQTIRTVADTIDAGRQADAVIADAQARLAALPGPRADGPTVLFIEWLDPLMPGGHWVPEQISYAGGSSLLTVAGQHSSPFRWEVVPALRPDVIIVGPCGFTPEQTAGELPLLARQPGWADLPAVRSGQVWIVDGPAHFNRPGPRIVDGAETLAAILAGRPSVAAWRAAL